MKLLEQVRKPTLDLPVGTRRKMWVGPFLRSYFVVLAGYASMYLIRKNFNISQNDLIEKFGFTKTNLGLIGFWFSITYGVGKTVVSYYGDGKNTKNYLSILLILASICMFGFGIFAGSLSAMIFFYAMNGFFQSAGGPSSYATLSKWSPRKFRGTALGFWNISHNIGGALAATVAVFGSSVVFNGDVRGMFLFPALVAATVGIIGLFIGSDSPEAYGLGKSEELFSEKISTEDHETEKNQLTKWQIFVKYIVKNPVILGLCFANVFVYIVRIGIDQWAVVYAKEVLGFSNEVARSGFTHFEMGAILSITWGMFSDFIKGRRALTSILSLCLILVLVPIYQHAQSPEVYQWSLFGLGFLVFGPQLLIGVSALSFVPKSSISVADGVKGTFGYLLGDSFAKIGLGMMADKKLTIFGKTGWDGTFSAIYLSSIIAIFILIYVAYLEEKKIRQNHADGIH